MTNHDLPSPPYTRGSRAPLLCSGLLGLAVALLAGLPVRADRADAGQTAAPAVRVQLFEREGPTRISGHLFTPSRGGLRVDGVRRGPAIRIAGPGPHQTETHLVRGAVEVRRTRDGLLVINQVPLEDYVTATVGGEVIHSWHDEVLKAQAVVSRTYALHQQARSPDALYDVSAGTRHQVYAGVAGESPRIARAVRATRGEVLVYEGEPILAAFHSASGGRTASSAEVWGEALPYLPSRRVPDERDSPDHDWRAIISGPTLARALAPHGLRPGVVEEVRVLDRSQSGRVRTLWIDGPRGGGRLAARTLRRVVGASVIRSTLFEVRAEGGDFVFAGSGHGHGVGMSQWGARAMAREGAGYREILATFYPGASLERRGVQETARLGSAHARSTP